jgi:hypothetical protein
MRKALIFAAVLAAGGPGFAQAPAAKSDFPTTFKNLKVFDKDIAPKELKAAMDGFTDQLGVKCTFCHVLDAYDKDERPHKNDARQMIQLVNFMKANMPKYFAKEVKPEKIECWLCHRGEAEIEKQ